MHVTYVISCVPSAALAVAKIRKMPMCQQEYLTIIGELQLLQKQRYRCEGIPFSQRVLIPTRLPFDLLLLLLYLV